MLILYSKHVTYVACHYAGVIMSSMASQITSVSMVCPTVCSGADQRKHQSSAPLAFVGRIHRSPVNSHQKRPVTRKMCPFDDVIMLYHQVFVSQFIKIHFQEDKTVYFTLSHVYKWPGDSVWPELSADPFNIKTPAKQYMDADYIDRIILWWEFLHCSDNTLKLSRPLSPMWWGLIQCISERLMASYTVSRLSLV